jgi:hypothetical protein
MESPSLDNPMGEGLLALSQHGNGIMEEASMREREREREKQRQREREPEREREQPRGEMVRQEARGTQEPGFFLPGVLKNFVYPFP